MNNNDEIVQEWTENEQLRDTNRNDNFQVFS